MSMRVAPCKSCGGKGEKEALAVTVGDKNIYDATDGYNGQEIYRRT